MFLGNLTGFSGEIGDLGFTEQQGLPGLPVVALVSVHSGLERRRNRLDDLRIATIFLKWLNHAARHRVSGSNAGLGTVDPLQRVFTVSHPPVPLQTLRRNPRANFPAISDALGQTGVVAVQQYGRVAVQAVDLKKAGIRHRWVSLSSDLRLVAASAR